MPTLALRCSYAAWATFIIVWCVSAFRTKRTQMRESVLEATFYRSFAVIGFLLLISSHRIGGIVSAQVIYQTAGIAYLSIVSSVTGLTVCILARITLGANWSSSAVIKNDHELVQSGPYRFVRHPIYSGILLMILADVLLAGQLGSVIALAFFVVSFAIKLSKEEQMMIAHFPTEYPTYARRVRRLIPFVY